MVANLSMAPPSQLDTPTKPCLSKALPARPGRKNVLRVCTITDWIYERERKNVESMHLEGAWVGNTLNQGPWDEKQRNMTMYVKSWE